MKHNRVLLAACLAALTLVAAGWLYLGREAPTGSAPAARTVLASPPADDSLSAPGDAESPVREARARAPDEAPSGAPAPDAAPGEPATVIGSLRIDGELQERGEVELRDAAGSWSCKQPLNYGGKFRFDDVPSGDLTLAFELPAGAQRQLFVGSIDVATEPGEVAELGLELASTQVNVRVLLAAEPGWNQAHVEIAGPRLTASVETDEDGKCALGLVGKGRFKFTATTRAGAFGYAFVELEGGEGLESVVISPEDAYY